MPTLPTYYIPHGGGPCFFTSPRVLELDAQLYGPHPKPGPIDPCFFMDWEFPTPNPWTELAGWLEGLAGSLGAPPAAVLVISGHWESEPVALNVQAHPPLFYDYY